MTSAEAAFGAAVRLARTELAWTQEQARTRLLHGYAIDLSKTAFSRLEQVGRPLRLNEAHALADLLGIDLSTLAVDVTRIGHRLLEEIETTEDRVREAEIHLDQLRQKLSQLQAVLR